MRKGALRPIRISINKINTVFLMLFMFFLLFVFAENLYTTDQIVYNNAYHDNIRYYFGPGYSFLTNVVKSISASYVVYKYIVGTIVLFAIKSRFEKTDSLILLWGLMFWFLTSYLEEAEQSRFFIASIIVLFSTKWLNNNSKRNIISFVISIAIASSVHISCLFYYIFLVSFLPNEKTITNCLLLLTAFISIVGFINSNNFFFLGNMLYAIIHNERILLWFSYNTRWGFLGPWLIHIMLTVILYCIYVDTKKRNYLTYEENDLLDLCRKINKYLFIAFPLYQISTDFIRIERTFLLINYIIILTSISKKKNRFRIIYLLFLLLFCITFNLLVYKSFLPWTNAHFIPVLKIFER